VTPYEIFFNRPARTPLDTFIEENIGAKLFWQGKEQMTTRAREEVIK
jgi:hypothetical protein